MTAKSPMMRDGIRLPRALLSRLGRAAAHPVETAYRAWSRLHGGGLIARYQSRARAAGIGRLYLVVSFDCDTAEDIAAAAGVHRRMRGIGITPAYAVPGALLEEGSATYRRIAADGAEFLNHGNRRHTYFDQREGRYKSCFFYDEESQALIEEDIVAGDRAVRAVLGAAPGGFRTPHFGRFQRPRDLRFLHRVLKRLGYRYSSSTSPFYGLRYGPVFDRFGLPEIPVSGGDSRALTIIDSWGCFEAPARRLGAEDYRAETVGLARRLQGGSGVLNYYADPSHIVDQPVFFETMAELARLAQPVTFADLMAMRA